MKAFGVTAREHGDTAPWLIGKVESLWRYPGKSMRGEELDEAFASYSGIYGNRVFALRSSANHNGFSYFTARDQRRLLQYRTRFRYLEKAAHPIDLIAANLAEVVVDVETPAPL